MSLAEKNGNSEGDKDSSEKWRPFFINALEDFEKFYNNLMKQVNFNTKEKQYSEPINFDHRFFYVFFGVPVGLCIPLLLAIFIYLDIKLVK